LERRPPDGAHENANAEGGGSLRNQRVDRRLSRLPPSRARPGYGRTNEWKDRAPGRKDLRDVASSRKTTGGESENHQHVAARQSSSVLSGLRRKYGGPEVAP